MRDGGILEILVDHIQEDGTGYLHRPWQSANCQPVRPGGPIKTPPGGWADGVGYSPDLAALVTKVQDSTGKEVWCHALCLDEQGKKVSAAEKRHRLVKAGLLKIATEHPKASEPPEPPKAPKFALLAQATMRFLTDPGRINFWPSDLWAVCRKHDLAKGWDKRKTLQRLFGSTFATTRTRLREAQKIVFDQNFSALICATSQQSPEALLEMLSTARLPFGSCWIEWDRSTSPDLRTAPANVHDVLLGQWGVLLRAIGGDSHRFVALVAYPGDLRVLPVALMIDCRDAIPCTGTPTEVGDSMERRWRHMLLRPYMDHWSKHKPALIALSQHGGFTLEHTPYGKPMQDLVDAAEGKAPEIDAYFSQCSLFAGSVFRELLVGLALVATHVGGGPYTKELAAKTQPAYWRGRFHPAVEYKVLQLARPMTAPHLWRHFRRRAKAERMRWHQVIGAWHHQRAPCAQCNIHPRACPIVVWRSVEPRDGPDGLREEHPPGDIQACILCKRRRWWVRDHARGDVREGMLEKDYENNCQPPKKVR